MRQSILHDVVPLWYDLWYDQCFAALRSHRRPCTAHAAELGVLEKMGLDATLYYPEYITVPFWLIPCSVSCAADAAAELGGPGEDGRLQGAGAVRPRLVLCPGR